MKKCPTCDKTFDDGMRFCQTDGTQLVDISETESDEYKTVVSNQNEISAPPADPFKTMLGVPPVNKTEEDFSQNQMVDEAGNVPSQSPFGDASSANDSAQGSFDASYSVPSETPKFNEPSVNALDLGGLSSPDSFSKAEESNLSESTLVFDRSAENASPKIDSSPFSEGSYNQSSFENPVSQTTSTPFDTPPQTDYQPPFKEPEKPFGAQNNQFNQSPFEQSQNPFGQQSSTYNAPMQQTEWTPPPAPVSNWQDQGLGANTPFQPPVAGQGQDQTLAIVSLVTGILSILCCGPVTGIPAIITGYLAKNNINANPNQYAGRGMATAGMLSLIHI